MALAVVQPRLFGFTQPDIERTRAAVLRLRATERLDVVELTQPARQIAAHDIGMGFIVAPFAVNNE